MMSTDRLVNSDTGSQINEMQGRILEAARHFFADRGYAATSLREVAAEAGVTKPMIYYYFGSKEGLYRALLEHAFASFRAGLEQTVGGGIGCRKKLHNIAKLHMSFLLEHADLMRLVLLSCLARSDGGAPELGVEKMHELFTAVIAAVLDEGKKQGEIRDVDVRVFAAIFGGSMAALASPHWHRPEPGLPERIIDLLWKGIAANRD